MNFDIEVKPFLSILSTAQSVLSMTSTSGHFFALTFAKGKARLLAEAESGATLSFALDSCVKPGKDAAQLGFEPPMLTAALAKRGSVSVLLKKNMLAFKSIDSKGSNYSGDIVTVPFRDSLLDIENRRKASSNVVALTPEAVRLLRLGVTKTRLHPVHGASSDILTYLNAKGRQMHISSFDEYHSALYTSAHIPKLSDFQLSVPAIYFDMFAKVTALYSTSTAHSLGLQADGKAMVISGEGYFVALPSIQSPASLFGRAEDLMNRTAKHTASFEIGHAALSAAVENFSSIYEAGSDIKVESLTDGKKGSVKLRAATSYGNLSDTMEVTNVKLKGPFKPAALDPETLNDSLGSFESTVKVAFCDSPATVILSQSLDKDGDLVHIAARLSIKSK